MISFARNEALSSGNILLLDILILITVLSLLESSQFMIVFTSIGYNFTIGLEVRPEFVLTIAAPTCPDF